MQADVVVVGSGMPGLVAAVRALENNADVIVLEKGNQVGGTTRITGGHILVNRDMEPTIDVYDPIDQAIEWLEAKGVDVEREDWGDEGIQFRIDPPDFVIHMKELIESNGGDVLIDTPFERLQTDDSGKISGVVASNSEYGHFEISAPSVILASGGRGASEEILSEYFPETELSLGRDPWSVGDGFFAAKEVGAKTTSKLAEPIGASLPAPPAQIHFDEMRCAQIYDSIAIAVDDDGLRFTDESQHRIGHYGFHQDFVTKTDGTACLIIDKEIYENKERYPQREGKLGVLVELARDLGGTVIQASSFEELERELDEAGVDGETAINTIQEFNDAMRAGSTAELNPPRTQYREPIDSAPFYAINVQSAIYYFVGGLDVNQHAQVVSRARSTTSLPYAVKNPDEVSVEPIAGLYAAGVEVGKGEEPGYYRAGLSLGLATGRLAGKHAAAHAKETTSQ